MTWVRPSKSERRGSLSLSWQLGSPLPTPMYIACLCTIVAVAPEAATEPDSVNWQDPGDGGGITEIGSTFQRIIALYRRKLTEMGEITDAPTAEELKMSPFDRMEFIVLSKNP